MPAAPIVDLQGEQLEGVDVQSAQQVGEGVGAGFAGPVVRRVVYELQLFHDAHRHLGDAYGEFVPAVGGGVGGV